MLTKYKIVLLILMTFALIGCKTLGQHREAIQDNSTDKVTVGKVQAEIKTGMSGAEVAAILGSPNIVTTDENRLEVWIYDKFSTETIYSSSSGGVNILVLGGFLTGSGAAGGGAGAGGQNSSGASSKSQKTLTIIIKYDENKKVRDFAYHSSSF
jgi:outer membrane protein assembly factor BamE (lipoprotein component of BamABCDE complex)